MKNNKITPAQIKIASSKSYTLRDLWTLAKEYADNADGNLGTDDTRLRLELSLFLTWLERKDRDLK